MLRRIALAIVLAAPAWSQTAAELEQRIANLPPDQQAYERFRSWISAQPAEFQSSGDVFEKYRAKLISGGVSGADGDKQIAAIRASADKLEIERWNRILTAEKPRFNTEPNAFLVETTKGRKPGAALDVGMGQGRNAIWLAQQGWAVTGFDPADRAVAQAKQRAESLGLKLTTEIKRSEDFDFGENRWDLIVLSYVGARDVAAQVQRALKPGGIVVVEGAHRDATKTTSIGGAVVFDTGELPLLFKDLRSVRYEEPIAAADFGMKKLRIVRYCGEKPE